jgi:MarC family membrane protein
MTLYSLIFTLVLILDPFGNIPLFLSVLDRFEPRRRKIIILRESVFAFFVLVFFLFFGRFILQGLNISQPALSISGGIILFLIAIRMIFPGKTGFGGQDPSEDSDPALSSVMEEPMFVPLAVPMQAGPSAMAFIILSSSQHPHQRLTLLLALFIASIICTTVLILSDYLRRLLGNQALRAIERLMGMILTTMAIQMLLTGFSLYLG